VNGALDPATRYGPQPRSDDAKHVYDVCIVGSGAGGAAAAWALAHAGLDVLVLEQGPHVDEQTSYDQVLASSEPAWVRLENGSWGRIGHAWSTCNVGGGTVFYGGVCFRHRPVDFAADLVLPGAELPLTWPWSPEDLAPYYDSLEELLGVAGDDADPAAPLGGRPHLLPPVPRSPEGEIIAEAAAGLGLRPFATPLAVNTRRHRGRPACEPSQPCISHRCPSGAKGDAITALLGPLLAAGRVRLFAGQKAVRLRRSEPGLVDDVECVGLVSGQWCAFRARCFVLACNAVQTAALLLRSRDGWSPRGLANDNGLVGAGLTFKLSEYLIGYGRCVPSAPAGHRRFGSGPFSTVSICDHYVEPSAPGGLGGLLYEARPEQTFGLGADECILRLECLVPDEPRLANQVRITEEPGDLGVPDVVMDYQPHPRDLARLEHLLQRGEAILRKAGCDIVLREPSGYRLGSCHLHGTCRSGRDPRTSVTDPDGRLHHLENVYVADGSVLPFPGAVNPVLTIEALALRTAHRLAAAVFGRRLGMDALLSEPQAMREEIR